MCSHEYRHDRSIDRKHKEATILRTFFTIAILAFGQARRFTLTSRRCFALSPIRGNPSVATILRDSALVTTIL